MSSLGVIQAASLLHTSFISTNAISPPLARRLSWPPYSLAFAIASSAPPPPTPRTAPPRHQPQLSRPPTPQPPLSPPRPRPTSPPTLPRPSRANQRPLTLQRTLTSFTMLWRTPHLPRHPRARPRVQKNPGEATVATRLLRQSSRNRTMYPRLPCRRRGGRWVRAAGITRRAGVPRCCVWCTRHWTHRTRCLTTRRGRWRWICGG